MLIMTNIDTLTDDQIPYLIEQIMKQGAKNVHVVPAMTKKGRQEHIFFIDIEKNKLDKIATFMAVETGTIGLRVLRDEHVSFDYEFKQVKLSLPDIKKNDININVKIVTDKQGNLLSVRAEYEDLKSAVDKINGFTFYELKQLVEGKVLKKIRKQKIYIEVK